MSTIPWRRWSVSVPLVGLCKGTCQVYCTWGPDIHRAAIVEAVMTSAWSHWAVWPASKPTPDAHIYSEALTVASSHWAHQTARLTMLLWHSMLSHHHRHPNNQHIHWQHPHTQTQCSCKWVSLWVLAIVTHIIQWNKGNMPRYTASPPAAIFKTVNLLPRMADCSLVCRESIYVQL